MNDVKIFAIMNLYIYLEGASMSVESDFFAKKRVVLERLGSC